VSAEHIAELVLVPIATGLVAAWVYARFFRARADLAANKSVTAAHDREDNAIPAATLHLTQSPIPGVGWVSDEIIDIPLDTEPGVYNTRFPGHDRAILADFPFSANGVDYVRTWMSFDLTGIHRTATKITRIRAVIDEQRPVPTGTVYYAVPQGIGEKDIMVFDLGSPDLDARTQDEDRAPTWEHYIDKKVTTLAGGESIGFMADVLAPQFGADIRYHLEICFAAGPPVTIYNDAGTPFRIVGYPRTAQRAYIAAGSEHHAWPSYPDYGGELEPDVT
jgi:hypothetical protein